MSVRLVLCTVPPDEAKALVDQLLAESLIACANMVGPLTSRYVWEGKVEESQETLLVMKSTDACVATLRERIRELHSYDVPEVLEFEASGGLGGYLDWVRATCRESGAGS